MERLTFDDFLPLDAFAKNLANNHAAPTILDEQASLSALSGTAFLRVQFDK